MNSTDAVQQFLTAASLLEKAASCLEYQNNLHKEASAAAESVINRGLGSAQDKEDYVNYFTANPEKIASTKDLLQDLPIGNNRVELGEIVGNASVNDDMDAFDRAVFGG